MAKIVLQTVCKYEYDTDTKKTRVLSNYTTPIGAGSWARKKAPKPLQPEEAEERYM